MLTDNSDFVEAIDSCRELHRTINSIVWEAGAGDPVALIWNRNDNPQNRFMTGLVVTQLQYGQKTYRVYVEFDNDRYTVRMLRKQKTVKSDYFAP